MFPALIWAALRLGPTRRDARGRDRRRLHRLGDHAPHGPFAFESITHSVLSPSCTSPYRRSRRCASPPWCPSARRSPSGWPRRAPGSSTPPTRERRRIEQNLHDGAQQRLTALVPPARSEQSARRRPTSPSASSEAAEAELARRSTSCATSRTASTPRRSPSTVSRTRSRASRRGPRCRSTCGAAVDRVRRDRRGRPPTSSSPRRSRTRSKYAHATSIDVRAAAHAACCMSRSRDDGAGGGGENARVRPSGPARPRRGDRRLASTIVSPPGEGTRIVATCPPRRQRDQRSVVAPHSTSMPRRELPLGMTPAAPLASSASASLALDRRRGRRRSQVGAPGLAGRPRRRRSPACACP